MPIDTIKEGSFLFYIMYFNDFIETKLIIIYQLE